MKVKKNYLSNRLPIDIVCRGMFDCYIDDIAVRGNRYRCLDNSENIG